MGCSVSPPRCGCLRVPTQGEHLLIYVCFMDLRLSRVKKTFERVSEIGVKCGGPSCCVSPRHFTSVSFSFSRACVLHVVRSSLSLSHTHTHTHIIHARAGAMPRCWRIRTYILSRQTNRIFFVSFFSFFSFFSSDSRSIYFIITFEQTWIIYVI